MEEGGGAGRTVGGGSSGKGDSWGEKDERGGEHNVGRFFGTRVVGGEVKPSSEAGEQSDAVPSARTVREFSTPHGSRISELSFLQTARQNVMARRSSPEVDRSATSADADESALPPDATSDDADADVSERQRDPPKRGPRQRPQVSPSAGPSSLRTRRPPQRFKKKFGFSDSGPHQSRRKSSSLQAFFQKHRQLKDLARQLKNTANWKGFAVHRNFKASRARGHVKTYAGVTSEKSIKAEKEKNEKKTIANRKKAMEKRTKAVAAGNTNAIAPAKGFVDKQSQMDAHNPAVQKEWAEKAAGNNVLGGNKQDEKKEEEATFLDVPLNDVFSADPLGSWTGESQPPQNAKPLTKTPLDLSRFEDAAAKTPEAGAEQFATGNCGAAVGRVRDVDKALRRGSNQVGTRLLCSHSVDRAIPAGAQIIWKMSTFSAREMHEVNAPS